MTPAVADSTPRLPTAAESLVPDSPNRLTRMRQSPVACVLIATTVSEHARIEWIRCRPQLDVVVAPGQHVNATTSCLAGISSRQGANESQPRLWAHRHAPGLSSAGSPLFPSRRSISGSARCAVSDEVTAYCETKLTPRSSNRVADEEGRRLRSSSSPARHGDAAGGRVSAAATTKRVWQPGKCVRQPVCQQPAAAETVVATEPSGDPLPKVCLWSGGGNGYSNEARSCASGGRNVDGGNAHASRGRGMHTR